MLDGKYVVLEAEFDHEKGLVSSFEAIFLLSSEHNYVTAYAKGSEEA